MNAGHLVHEIYDRNLPLAQQVTSEQIRFYCRLMSRQDPETGTYANLLPRYASFLYNLVCVNDVIIKRNQVHVLNALKLHQFPLLRLYDRFTWEPGQPETGLMSALEMMAVRFSSRFHHVFLACVLTFSSCFLSQGDESDETAGGVAFHIAIVSLLGRSCLGKNKPAESLCSQLIPSADAHHIICHKKTTIPVKQAYLMFVDEVFVKTEATKKNMFKEEWCWSILASVLADVELLGKKESYSDRTAKDFKQLRDYTTQAVFPFVEYWFREIVRTKDAKLMPENEDTKVKLFQAIRMLGAPPVEYRGEGVTWPLMDLPDGPAETTRVESLCKKCCQAIQTTLNDEQAAKMLRDNIELQELKSSDMYGFGSRVTATDGGGSGGKRRSSLVAATSTDTLQLGGAGRHQMMSEEELFQHKLSAEFAMDFGRLCSAPSPVLYTFLDPDEVRPQAIAKIYDHTFLSEMECL